MFTGSLENDPIGLKRLAAIRPLLGGPIDAIRAVRDWRILRDLAESSSLVFPETTDDPSRVPRDGSYIRKPRDGSGGIGIGLWFGPGLDAETRDASCESDRRPWIYQRRVEGRPVSALLLLDGLRCRILGATRQLIGLRDLGASQFGYAGNLGPLRLPDGITERLERFGCRITTEWGLRGLIGVDAIWADPEFAILEVNPRYTASVEVWERLTGVPVIELHCAACEQSARGRLSMHEPISMPNDVFLAKGVIYAEESGVFPDSGPWDEALAGVDSVGGIDAPTWADIPWPGTPLTPGHPILTIFASGPDTRSCQNVLIDRAREVRRWIWGPRAIHWTI